MTKAFKKGDKVRYKDIPMFREWHGYEGVVESASESSAVVKATKAPTLPNALANVGGVNTLTPDNLELIPTPKADEPKPFTYGDIQKGDTIRRTKVYKSGAKEVREGVATTKGTYYWADEDGNFILAYDKTAEHGDITYELLNRPEPKPAPKITDGTKAGDQIVVVRTVNTKVYTKKSDDMWDTLIIGPDEKPNKGFSWTDAEVAVFTSYGTATLVKA